MGDFETSALVREALRALIQREREFRITEGRLQGGGARAKPEIADYVLIYRNTKLAVIEAKA